jgi:predicted metalloprotease with PDZ domain
MGMVIVHELSHLWNRADAWWLNEGVTRYFEVLLSHRLDRRPARSIAEALLDVYGAYEQSIGKLALRDATDTLAYHGGATLAFCLDGELRAEKSSLFALHRAVRERAGAGAALEARRFFEELSKTAPSAAARAEQRLGQAGPFDATDCFRSAGFRLAAVSYRGFTADALAVDVLGVGGHDTSSARVYRIRPGSPFEEGDLIVRAQGKPVRRMQDVDRWLAAVVPGRKFQLEVERRGTKQILSFEMPELDSDARETHRALTVAPIPGAQSWLAAD